MWFPPLNEVLTYGHPESHDKDNRGAEIGFSGRLIVAGISVVCDHEIRDECVCVPHMRTLPFHGR